MVTAAEALRLGGLRLACTDAAVRVLHYQKLVVNAEQALIKTKAQFDIYLTSLSERGNEPVIRT